MRVPTYKNINIWYFKLETRVFILKKPSCCKHSTYCQNIVSISCIVKIISNCDEWCAD